MISEPRLDNPAIPLHPHRPAGASGAAGRRPLAALCTGAALAAASAGALAGGPRHAEFVDTARVIAVRPVVQRVVEPQRECSLERVATSVPAHARVDVGGLAGPVIGGVAGGVIGSQVGGGSGRTAATIAGAVAGTIAGTMIGERHGGGAVVYPPRHEVERVVERCRTVNRVREVVAGYDVTYRHRGRDFMARMPYDPGRFVQVGVAQPRGGKHRGGRRDEVRVVVIEQGPGRQARGWH